MFDFFGKKSGSQPQSPNKRQSGYEFTAALTHGFPTQPSAFDFDPILKIAVIGTRNGCLRVFGAPGIELTGACDEDGAILKVKWIPGKGLIAVLLDTWSILLFQIVPLENSKTGEMQITLKCEYKTGTKTEITSWEYFRNKNVLLCGTDSANIFALSLKDLSVCHEYEINYGFVSNYIKNKVEHDKALGSVEAIEQNKKDTNDVVIGYSRGIAVIYNYIEKEIKYIVKSQFQLEALDWYDSDQVILAYQNGSIYTWDLNVEVTEVSSAEIMYGPMPCKPITIINKINDLKVFNGGLPRASYGDRYSITVMSSQAHVVFDFSSKVIDYQILRTQQNQAGSMAILCEEELVVIDLLSPKWPSYSLPYMSPLHSSALTACNVVQVNPDIVDKITKLGNPDNENVSKNSWPIPGGQSLRTNPEKVKNEMENILLTGHEDGSIRIWDLTNNQMKQISKINTLVYFNTDDYDDCNLEETEDWPPFRKVGLYDPYSDDPRLGVRRLDMCGKSGTVLAGGTAGQCIVFILSETAGDHNVPTKTIDFLENQEEKVKWKGHEQLIVKTERHFEMIGYQAQSIIQCNPPGAVTALSLNASWGVIGIGTSHGYTLFDYRLMNTIIAKCTLESTEAAQEGFTRGKSIRHSLRQSMRKIRSSFRSKNRNQRTAGSGRRPKSVTISRLDRANEKLREEDLGHKEVRIERRPPTVETANQHSVVKTMMFATTHVKDGLGICPTFWVGTASGCVYFFALTVPDYNNRDESGVECIYAKMIQMHHRAPIVNISIIDRDGPVSIYNPDSSHLNHQLVITTEEQIKVYSLPKVQFKSKKFKLTALEGSIIRKAQFAKFQAVKGFYSLMTLTNQGDIILFNLDSEKHVILDQRYQCMDKDNAMGLFYSNLTSDGQGLYLLSPSEFQRFSSNSRLPSTTPCRISTCN